MTETGVPIPVLHWKSLAEKYAAIHPVLEANEILAIIWTESTGHPNSQNPADPSWGLMGVTMLIARAFGQVTEYEQLFDPDINVKCGSGFLAHLKTAYAHRFPNWMCGYNEGETNLLKGYKDQGYWDSFNNHLAALNALKC
jgi:soluble lytic murein transglycosylase-like protein